MSTDEDNSEYENEKGDEDSDEDFLEEIHRVSESVDGAAGCGLPSELSSPLTEVLDIEDASSNYLISPASVLSLGIDSPSLRNGASRATSFIMSQEDQRLGRQQTDPEVAGSNRHPDSEADADIFAMTEEYARISNQRQSTYPAETEGLYQSLSDIGNTATSLLKRHEELQQNKDTIQSNLTKNSERFSVIMQNIMKRHHDTENNGTSDDCQTIVEMLSGANDLYKKRKIEAINLEEFKLRRSKLNAEIKEFVTARSIN